MADTAIPPVPTFDMAVANMVDALTAAAAQFRFYANENKSKAAALAEGGDAQAAALAKAETNEEFAARCDAALVDVSAAAQVKEDEG